MSRPPSPDIKRLKREVEAAVVASQTPPEPGVESWPFTFPQEHLTPDAWALVWGVIRHIRRNELALYRRFIHPHSIGDFIVDFLVEASATVGLSDVLDDLRARAVEADWLVDIPLLNLAPPRETVPLGKGAMVVRSDWTRREGPRTGPYLKDIWAVKRHLQDELTPRNRWLPSSRTGEVDLDTRMMASLLLVVHGTEEIARTIAETRARLVVALWCLLSPPHSLYANPLWPTVGGWTPAAYTVFQIQRKLYEPDPMRVGRALRRGNRITTHDAPYSLTRSHSYQMAPFVALEQAQSGNQCALAILSAARSLYLAARNPNDFDRTERIMFVWRARAALAHRGTRGQGKTDQRWHRLVVRLRLRRELSRHGYSAEEIDEAFALVESWRDLTTHFADDVLVNLDYPPKLKTVLTKGRVLDADKAALALVSSDWPMMLHTVQVAARRLAKGAIAQNWDERWFHSRFA